MHITVHHHSVALCWQTGGHWADVVLAVIGHDIVGSNKSGHIATGLCRQVGIDIPVVLIRSLVRLSRFGSIGAMDGFVDILWSAVISGNHQVPVAKDFV